ncbi:MAG: DUF2911 domain-containing protein [Calditrichaeota bacterium]|nr:DUF2911 domain-containing protein [Calditrichota bacterium]
MRFFISLILLACISAQNLQQPRVSPAAEVRQTIGFSEIVVNYSRPQVNGRQIYGTSLAHNGMVASPYGLGTPAPWRAGANENTTFEITDDAMINGKKLPAGKYGLFMEVNPDKWTIIFNKDNKSWGNFFYIKDQDALRFDVTPKTIANREALIYYFDDIEQNSATLYMEWEKKQVSFKIEFDYYSVVMENFRQQLSNIPGFGNGWIQAATFCMNNKVNQEEAIRWADQSLKIYPNRFNDLSVKAGLLEQIGKKSEAETIMRNALANGSEADINTYAYNLLAQKRFKEAIDKFKSNTEKYPDSWNAFDSLADAYGQSGDKKESIRLYKKALEMAPAAQKGRIQKLISDLQN